MSGGSQQLRMFRRALHLDGKSLEDAAALVGMGLTEAKLIAADDAKHHPAPEAFELIGHNSKGKTMASATDDRLRLLVERIERLEEERRGIGDDIKDVYGEAKATGYDAAIIRKIIRLRRMKPDDRKEAEALLLTYGNALGMDLQLALF